MRAKNWLKKYGVNIFSVFLILAFSIFVQREIIQNDTYSAVANGNYILEHGLDEEDHFTIHQGIKYIKYRWGFDIAVALIHNQFGFEGIKIAVILLSALIGVTIFCLSKKITGKTLVSTFIALVVLFLARDYLCARAQTFSYLLFLLEIVCLYAFYRRGEKRWLSCLPVLSMLILTFHATTWDFFLILQLPFIADAVFLNRKNLKTLTAGFILSSIPLFISPLGIKPLTYPILMFGNTISREIIYELSQPSVIELLIFLLPVTLIFANIILYNRKKIADLFLCFGLIVFSAVAERNLMLSYFCLAPLVIYNFQDFSEKIAHRLAFSRILAAASAVAIVLLFILSRQKTEILSISEQEYPTGVANYILNNVDIETFRAYNELNKGAYLDYYGVPSFIDSRTEIFESKIYNNVDVLADFKRYYLDEDYEYIKTIIKKYNLNYVLTKYSDAGNLYYLKNQSFLEQEYNDYYFTLYRVKTDIIK